MDLVNEIEQIKFRMGLLREGTELSLFIYDAEITSEQWEAIRSLFTELNDRILKGEQINSHEYEQKILSFVDQEKLDHHFAENIARIYWENDQHKEVFETLYNDSPKFFHLFR